MRSIIVIAAHPDDEVLGCGGTIAKHTTDGDKVHVVFMTDGVSSRGDTKQEDIHNRDKACLRAIETLNVTGVYNLGFDDNSMDNHCLLAITKKLEKIIEKISPEVIYTHHSDDLNVDHRLTFQAVMTAARPTPSQTIKSIYSFEVLSSTDWAGPAAKQFNPNVYVNITNFYNIKRKALECYDLEMREPPHSRSVYHSKILAEHRGHTVGVQYAEAFELLRMVV